jgi:TusA-related sulfurtransferase
MIKHTDAGPDGTGNRKGGILMFSSQANDERWHQIGESWIQGLAKRDFGQLALLCQPDVRGRLLTPRAFDTVDNAPDLERKFQQWFGKSDLVRIEQTQIQRVGEKSSIFYRLLLRKQGEWFEVEQHISSLLRDDLIGTLDLLCSGFQAVPVSNDTSAVHDASNDVRGSTPASSAQSKSTRGVDRFAPAADAVLLMDTSSEAQGSTCSVLTPAIKARLREMASGQVLRVQVDDTTARGDIQAWCRLSGNELLAVMAAESGQGMSFFIKKK